MTVRRRFPLFTVVVALLSAGIAGVGVYACQQGRLDHTQDRLERVQAVTEDATKEQTTLAEDVTELGTRVDRSRKRRLAAQEDARGHQDCVARVSDQNAVGTHTVVFGFAHLSGNGTKGLLVDEAEWFSGSEASEAAVEDGVIEAGNSVPNDYHIRNEDRVRVAMPVADGAVIVLSTATRGSIPSPRCLSWREFEEAMRNPEPWERTLRQSPYWLTAQNGEVVRIVEQYRP